MQKGNPQKAACICLAVIIVISFTGCSSPIEEATQTSSVSTPEPTAIPVDLNETVTEQSSDNMVQNGDFSDDTASYIELTATEAGKGLYSSLGFVHYDRHDDMILKLI